MASQGASQSHPVRPRCGHCGRQVHETRHTRTSYRVDYYSMHTGDVDEATLSSHNGENSVSYLKLIRPVEVVSCVDCYREPAIREERERLFRPELIADQD